MKVLINYGNNIFKKSQEINSQSALKIGGFDEVISYHPKDIDSDFYKKNKEILEQERGNGYWLWKSYFINKAMQNLSNGDYLFYCDSGSYFINSIDPIIKLCKQYNQDIIPFNVGAIEKYWTKRDVFISMNCDMPEFTDTEQRLGGFILFKKSDKSIKFIDEYLSLTQDYSLITDVENSLGSPNYNGFIAHRHDQSIFSLLTKKYKLEAFRDLSQFGNDRSAQYPNLDYNQIIQLTRKRKKPFRKKKIYKILTLQKFRK